jgi:hypothetical protein
LKVGNVEKRLSREVRRRVEEKRAARGGEAVLALKEKRRRALV